MIKRLPHLLREKRMTFSLVQVLFHQSLEAACAKSLLTQEPQKLKMKVSKEKQIEEGEKEIEKIENDLNETSNLKGDYGNIAILLFFYLLQGIPLGIAYAIPILLQNRGVSYADQAGFSFAFYPFTLKILWAPLLDSVYLKSFGRRKSWVVPSQFLIGAFLIFIGCNIDEWLGDGKTQKPQMFVITSVFFSLWMLTATQDVAVDGWALTMLQRKNVGYAGMVNCVGATTGFFIGYSLFVIFDSDKFHSMGLSLSSFALFWGFVFLGTTTLVAIFKNEKSGEELHLEDNPDYGITKAYPMLWKILKLKPVLKFSLVLLTAKVGFAVSDAITTLKLIDRGLPKDTIAYLAVILLPCQLIIQLASSRYTTGSSPMSFYMKAYPFRLFMTIIVAGFVYVTPLMIGGSVDQVPVHYYAAYLVVFIINHIPTDCMNVADTAFMARISDPLVGSTYMTLLNTIGNIGNRYVKTFFLWLVDIITWKSCNYDQPLNSTILLTHNDCANEIKKTECIESGGHCQIDMDGYYLEVAMNVIYGMLWYSWGKKTLEYLQNLKREEWHVLSKASDEDDNQEKTPLDEFKNRLQIRRESLDF